MCVYIYIYIYIYIGHVPRAAGVLHRLRRGVQPRARAAGGAREFHEPGFDISLHSFCADSSSPQISAIRVGHFGHFTIGTMTVSASPRKTFTTNPQKHVKILAREIP